MSRFRVDTRKRDTQARRRAERVRPVNPQAAGAGGDRADYLRPERAAEDRVPAGRALRDLRKIAEGAKNDLREGLGPEFSDFDIEDLNPKRFVQKHLLDDINGDSADRRPPAAGGPASPAAAGGPASTAANQATARQAANGTLLAPGERPPYDVDAT